MQSRARKQRSLFRTTVLLCLIAHAVLVTVTHHHPETQRLPGTAEASIEAGGRTRSGTPLQTSKDMCCLLCSLQRHSVTEIRPISIVPVLSSEPVSLEMFVWEPSCNGVLIVLSDRAPPLA